MSTGEKQLLTHSRIESFKSCRRKCMFSYELGIRRDLDAKALRQGSAFHNALESLGNGQSLDFACGIVNEYYERCPEQFDALEWDYERETVVRMVCGYMWRWADSGLEYVVAEQQFELPLINPETGKPTPVFSLAGKIDGIVKLPDGRLAVIEHKLLSGDIDPDSFLWRQKRRDTQISIYVLAARRLGYAVDCVLYDVARKPTIKPTSIPVLDELGAKIVLDQYGHRVRTEKKTWRQTGDKEKGYILQEQPMSATEWGDKLNTDIAERPEFYFQRAEIARMDDDLRDCEQELWQIQLSIREAQKTGRWFRTVAHDVCKFCAYDSICDRKSFDDLPEGFVKIYDLHPELNQEKANVN